MLGRLKMDVQDCIDICTSMFQDIFGTKAHSKVSLLGQIQSQYDSEILRRCILKVIQESGNLSECDKKAITKAADFYVSEEDKQAELNGAASKILLDDGVRRGCKT